MPRALSNNALEKMVAKRDQLQAKIEKHRARVRTTERKQDTRRKIIAGAILLEHAEKDAEFASTVNDLLDRFVTRSEDRELFNLPVR